MPGVLSKFCFSQRGLLARDLAEENSTALQQYPVRCPVPLSKKRLIPSAWPALVLVVLVEEHTLTLKCAQRESPSVTPLCSTEHGALLVIRVEEQARAQTETNFWSLLPLPNLPLIENFANFAKAHIAEIWALPIAYQSTK